MFSSITVFSRSGFSIGKTSSRSTSSTESFELVNDAPQAEDPFLTILKARTSLPRHSSCMCALCCHRKKEEEDLAEFSRSFGVERTPTSVSAWSDSGHGSTDEDGQVRRETKKEFGNYVKESKALVKNVVKSGLRAGGKTVALVRNMAGHGSSR